MGILGSHYRLTREHLNEIGQTKKINFDHIIEAIHFEKILSQVTEFLMDYYPINYLDWRELLENGIYDVFIHHGEYQREAIHYNDAETVKIIAESLSKIDKDEIKKLYFGDYTTNNPLGKNEKEILFDYKYLINLIDFYQRAAEDNNFVIIDIG